MNIEIKFLTKMQDCFKARRSSTAHVIKSTNKIKSNDAAFIEANRVATEIENLIGEQKIDAAIEFFEKQTGLKLHFQDNKAVEFITMFATEAIKKAQKLGTISNTIKHVVIGHGMGSFIDKTWSFMGTGVKVQDFLSDVIPKGEEVLLFVCERGRHVHKKPGIGRVVTTTLTNRRHPAKIYKDGEIIGHQLLNKAVYY